MYGICGWEVRERSPRKRIMEGISEIVQGHVNNSAGHKMCAIQDFLKETGCQKWLNLTFNWNFTSEAKNESMRQTSTDMRRRSVLTLLFLMYNRQWLSLFFLLGSVESWHFSHTVKLPNSSFLLPEDSHHGALMTTWNFMAFVCFIYLHKNDQLFIYSTILFCMLTYICHKGKKGAQFIWAVARRWDYYIRPWHI